MEAANEGFHQDVVRLQRSEQTGSLTCLTQGGSVTVCLWSYTVVCASPSVRQRAFPPTISCRFYSEWMNENGELTVNKSGELKWQINCLWKSKSLNRQSFVYGKSMNETAEKCS